MTEFFVTWGIVSVYGFLMFALGYYLRGKNKK